MKLAMIALIAVLGLAPLNAVAQPISHPAKLGILYWGGSYGDFLDKPLRDLGYEKGRNLSIEERVAAGSRENLPRLAAELVSLRPDVLLASGTPSVLALKQATDSIPIVMMDVGDALTNGLIQSFAHPGGNITGFNIDSVRLFVKINQLATEVFPGACCLLWLRNQSNPGNIAATPIVIKAIQPFGIEVKISDAATAEQQDQFMQAPLDDRFNKILLLMPDPAIFSRRAELAEYALRRGLALLAPFRTERALISYQVDYDEMSNRIASFVDKILKGAKPGDLPVELPTKFKTVIDLRSAKALGLTIPVSIIGQATEVIE